LVNNTTQEDAVSYTIPEGASFLAGPEKMNYAFWFISAETAFVCAFYSNFAQKSVGC